MEHWQPKREGEDNAENDRFSIHAGYRPVTRIDNRRPFRIQVRLRVRIRDRIPYSRIGFGGNYAVGQAGKVQTAGNRKHLESLEYIRKQVCQIGRLFFV